MGKKKVANNILQENTFLSMNRKFKRTAFIKHICLFVTYMFNKVSLFFLTVTFDQIIASLVNKIFLNFK